MNQETFVAACLYSIADKLRYVFKSNRVETAEISPGQNVLLIQHDYSQKTLRAQEIPMLFKWDEMKGWRPERK